MKRELFFLMLLIIAILLWQYSKSFMKEGFQEPVLTIPKPNPQPKPVSDGDPLPFASPSTSLLAPPPGQTASVNSYPSEDPSQKKAPLKRISNALETLNGFLKNEGPGLSKMGDPSVQLPLQTARADARRLQDEMNVLGRNPGIESTLTTQDLDQIESNMRYLQKKWRLSANSMSGAPVEGFSGFSNRSILSRILNFFSPREGFQDGSGSIFGGLPPALDVSDPSSPFYNLVKSSKTDDSGVADSIVDPIADSTVTYKKMADSTPVDPIADSIADPIADSTPVDPIVDSTADTSGVGDSTADTSGVGDSKVENTKMVTSTSTQPPTGNITVSQLNTLQVNLNSTIVRLSSSGSTSPLLNVRISILQDILEHVNGYLVQVQNGSMAESDIPIKQSDYNKFLPFVTSTSGTQLNEPLPTLISKLRTDSALANLFPVYFSGDVSGASLARQLFEKYAPNFFKNISYDLNVHLKHKSDSENAVAEHVARALANSVLPGSPAYATSQSQVSSNGIAPSASVRGELEERTNTMNFYGNGTSGSRQSQSNASTATMYSTAPTKFVWKDRANQICDQISKRGLNPDDYGCLQDPDDVDENFSYRGYARMICTRLGTNYDPSIPEVCGCPPLTWVGWRS